jgi:nitroreductase
MELYEAMRTNPSCRYFTDDPVDDETLHRVFDNARFASSGGNRQGWRTVVLRDPDLRREVASLHLRRWNTYLEHARDGVVGFNDKGATSRMDSGDRSQQRLDRTDDFAKSLAEVPALFVFCVELSTLAITDSGLDRPSIIGGGSIYPFVQNVLLACRNEGLGTALTTLLAADEPAVAELLGIPEGFAIAGLSPVGWPVVSKQYTKLTRNPVESFAFVDRWHNPLTC